MSKASLHNEANAMAGAAAPPSQGGEPVFDEPWQGRAMALAVETVHALGLPWSEFQQRLVDAISRQPDGPYYAAWLDALERLVVDHRSAEAEELTTRRMRAASYRTTEVDEHDLEVFPITADEATLLAMLTELFERRWDHIRFGPLVNGAVYELRAPHRPRLSMLDGYLTIAFDAWHVHLCIGEHRGLPGGRPVPPDLARRRRCAHAELQRLWVEDAPRTWMFRMFNGEEAQQLTVLLPNPFLDDDDRQRGAPDWSRLALWDELRARFLHLPPDPFDRLGDGLRHP